MLEIENFQMQKGDSAMKARFAIVIPKWGDFIIHDCTLFVSGDKKWINFPSKQYEHEGKKKYFQFCGFKSRELGDRFKEQALKQAYEIYSKQSVAKPTSSGFGGWDSNIDDEIPF